MTPLKTIPRSAANGPAADHSHAHPERQAMLTVHDVARMLNCSVRTVYRLNDAGKMPKPVRLGALVRWPRQAIEHWINDGCPVGEGR